MSVRTCLMGFVFGAAAVAAADELEADWIAQDGETASCVGCHESANTAPDFRITKIAALNTIAEVKPATLPPLTYGSRTSRLFTERLDKGHGKGITDAEKRVLACWVDLSVPFCGDYEEGAVWDEKDRAFWDYYTKKRAEFATALPTSTPATRHMSCEKRDRP